MTNHLGDRTHDSLAEEPTENNDIAAGVPSLITAINRSSSGVVGQGAAAIPHVLTRFLTHSPVVWGAGVWLVAPDRATLRCQAYRGQHEERLLSGPSLDVQRSLLGRIMRCGRPAQIPSQDIVPELLPGKPPRAPRTFVGVPLSREAEWLGILGLFTTHHLTPEEIALLTVLGRQAASEMAAASVEANGPGDVTSADQMALLAHELRTPLTGLRGNVQLAAMAARKGDYTRIPGRLNAALRLVDSMTAVIQNLQDLSRLERGRLRLRPVTADLTAAVRGAIRRAERTVLSDQHTIALDAGEPIVIAHDPQHIEQVIYNVLVNAAVYSPSGGTIDVRLFQRSDTAQVSVQDHGIGIPTEDRARIFEPYFRGARGRQAYAGGLGLGLTISRAIVERHGGAVDIHSQADEGTTVIVRLPVRHDASPID